jgi:hypothetical protein
MSQGQAFAVVNGTRVELGKVIFVKTETIEGYGYYNYTPDGVKFFKHGFAVETGPGPGDFRKGNFEHDLLQGEGEEQIGGLKYIGTFLNDEYDGIGKLTSLSTGKRHHGYFRAGRFVRPMKRTIPYLDPCVFLVSSDTFVTAFILKIDSDPFRMANSE